MVEDEEYELMPHQTIAKIKHELELLKKKTDSKEIISSKEVQKNIEKLNSNISNLLNLFTEAAKDIQDEDIKEDLDPLFDRMDTLEEENRKIAEGILVVADMLKDVKKGEKKVEDVLPKLKQMPEPVFRQSVSKPVPGPMPPRSPHVSMPLKAPTPGPMPRAPPMPNHKLAPGPMPRAPPMPNHKLAPGPMPRAPPMPNHKLAPGPMPRAPPMPQRTAGLGEPIAPPTHTIPLPKPMTHMGPPQRLSQGPSPLPPLPEMGPAPKKEGFFSKLFKKK